MKRLTLVTLITSLFLALVMGVFSLKIGKAYSDPLSSPGTLAKAHYKLENQVNNCQACHKTPWKGIANESCTGCHNRADFAKRSQDASTLMHQALDLEKQDCAVCHTEHKGFMARITKPMDHDLTKATQSSNCVDCHTVEQNRHLHAKNSSYNGDCKSCHNNKAWKPAVFSHAVVGETQLGDCAGCHEKDKTVHLSKNNENIFNSQCSNCHTYRSWQTLVFNHDRLSTSELINCINCHTKDKTVHLSANGQNIYGDACGSCHLTQAWKPAQVNVVSVLKDSSGYCGSCHASKMPIKHVEKYGNSCTDCHKSSNWRAVSLKHDATMSNCQQCHQKPSTEIHLNTTGQCSTCHYNGNWLPTKFSHGVINPGVQCVTCHQRQDNIHQGQYGTDCARCHKTTNWVIRKFVHPQGQINCSNCHQATQTSVHTVVSSNCSACHTISAWKPVRFDHVQIIVPQTCATCHSIERTYHVEQYMVNGECQKCHITQAWRPASFSHDYLEGQACISCHVEPKVSYHRGLGNNCQDCHTTKAWRPAKFNHEPYGPIPENHTKTCSSCHM